MNTQQRSRFVLLSALAFSACFGCRPGYIKATDLESKGQGPAACAKTCEDLGMRMAALVLVGDTLPGCVCQPVTVQAPAPKAEPPAPMPPPASAPVPPATPAPSGAPAPGTAAPPAQSSAPVGDGVSEGAAAATTGYIVIAAAVAAQQTQQDRQRQSSTPLSNF